MAAVPRLVRRVGEAVTLTAMSAFTSGQLAVRRAQQEVEMVVDTLTHHREGGHHALKIAGNEQAFFCVEYRHNVKD